MKRIYKSCVAVLLLLAMLLSCVPALAAGSSHSYTTLQKAEALKTLGLFQGTNKGFELESTLTREQAVTLIVRSRRAIAPLALAWWQASRSGKLGSGHPVKDRPARA